MLIFLKQYNILASQQENNLMMQGRKDTADFHPSKL